MIYVRQQAVSLCECWWLVAQAQSDAKLPNNGLSVCQGLYFTLSPTHPFPTKKPQQVVEPPPPQQNPPPEIVTTKKGRQE